MCSFRVAPPQTPVSRSHAATTMNFICLAGAFVVCGMLQLLAGNVSFANKLGLQRMRTQRLVRRALFHKVASYLNRSYDELEVDRSFRMIKAKHATLTKMFAHNLRDAEDAPLEARLEDLEADVDSFLAYDEQLMSWAAWLKLEKSAEEVVTEYTSQIVDFSAHQTYLLWGVVVINTLSFLLLAVTRYHYDRAQAEATTRLARLSKIDVEAKQRKFEKEIIDHRFGNKLRINRLLLENGDYDQLKTNLDSWQFELDIRRRHFNNLPQDPVTARALFETEFAFSHEVSCFCGDDSLLFFDEAGARVPYSILQVNFLQDIASNILKHGGARAVVVVDPSAITVTNAKVTNPDLPRSNKTGLRALQKVGADFLIPVDFTESDDTFTVKLQVCCEPVASSSVEPRTESSRDYGNFKWVLVEDSEMICSLSVKQFRRHGIDLRALSKPADAFGLSAILGELWHLSRKPIVVLMDENILTLNDNFQVVTETGTNLRTALLAHSLLLGLYNQRNLLFVSASASKVDDSRLVCKLGKSMSSKALISTLWDAVTAFVEEPPSH